MKRNLTALLLAILMLIMLPAAVYADTFNGEDIPFTDWTSAGFGGWAQSDDGVIAPTELTDFTLLRLEKDLGDEYTVELDVKQEDLTSGWQTIQIGFEVNPGENFTQSGFVLDLHNAGVGRVIVFSNANSGPSVPGSYDNPYGGNIGYAPNTEWRHVKIQRAGSEFTITLDNDPAQTITFTCDTVSGGHLVLGAVGQRMVSYKNIVVTTKTQEQEPEDNPPKTAESTHVVLIGTLMLVSACGIAALTLRKKEVA